LLTTLVLAESDLLQLCRLAEQPWAVLFLCEFMFMKPKLLDSPEIPKSCLRKKLVKFLPSWTSVLVFYEICPLSTSSTPFEAIFGYDW
jgi:hypothetical protein